MSDFTEQGEAAPRCDAVAEIQGLYGPFSFPEKLFQKIWLRGQFDRASAVALDGRRVRILHPGKWNLLGGPDFRGARLEFNGREVIGDVELHLRAEDWAAHRHAADRAYSRVVLHVVLFPPRAGHVTAGVGGEAIPALVLLPLLQHDLEEFAANEAVETLANRPISHALEELTALGEVELTALIRRHAERRWRQKVRFARLRLQRLGWTAACHHAALEILGYRFNRVPMLRIAAQHPLEAWAQRAVNADELFAENRENWSLQGVRPANHPRTRLAQYARWTSACPDWPERLRGAFARSLDAAAQEERGTRSFRREMRLARVRREIAGRICGNEIGGTRIDNLVCDGFWPLLAAESGRELWSWWYHWLAGDVPAHWLRSLRELGAIEAVARPACHGAAQGLVGWMIERETREAGFAPSASGRGA